MKRRELGDRETSQEAGRRAQIRGGREGSAHLGSSQPPTAAQLPPEQPLAADVVGPDLGKLLLSPYTHPHLLNDRDPSSQPPTS